MNCLTMSFLPQELANLLSPLPSYVLAAGAKKRKRVEEAAPAAEEEDEK